MRDLLLELGFMNATENYFVHNFSYMLFVEGEWGFNIIGDQEIEVLRFTEDQTEEFKTFFNVFKNNSDYA